MHYVLLHFFFIEIGALINLHSLFLIVLFHLSHDNAHFRISQASFFGNQRNLVGIFVLFFLLLVFLIVVIAYVAQLIQIVFCLGKLDGLQVVVRDLRVWIADVRVSRRIVDYHVEHFALHVLQGVQLVDCFLYFFIKLGIALFPFLLTHAQIINKHLKQSLDGGNVALFH